MPNPPLSKRVRDANRHPLIVAYVAEFKQIGRVMPAGRLTAARSFIRDVGGLEQWESLDVDSQLGLPESLRHFVLWLVITGRVKATADYALRSGSAVGRAATLVFPKFRAEFFDTAARLQYETQTIATIWSLLARIAALNAVQVTGVTAAMITKSIEDLNEAETRLAREGVVELGGVTRRGFGLANVLFQLGQIAERPARPKHHQTSFPATWDRVPEPMRSTMKRFVEQVEITRRPATAKIYGLSLRDFGCWVADNYPDITAIADLRRVHVEAYKIWLVRDRVSYSHTSKGKSLSKGSIRHRLSDLATFFDRLIAMEDPDAPIARLLYRADLPLLDDPLPRFLDDAAATKLMQQTRSDTTSQCDRLVIEILARTGMRQGEVRELTTDCVVQIGSSYWMRVPIGKLRTDRYVPLHPELKVLLDVWITQQPIDQRNKLLFHSHGRPWPKEKIAKIVRNAAQRSGIGHVTPHQLRHTLATQAINRGMSLEAIATLLGHKTMRMTMVYARIADRTVADEYFSVTEKVEALYQQNEQPTIEAILPADAEGTEMRKLRTEMHRRMLGNGYCARPVGMDCHFESVCEGCSFFVTTIEFKPTLRRQRDDAAEKGQIARQKLFDGILARLEDQTPA